jgi:hypothetical protein
MKYSFMKGHYFPSYPCGVITAAFGLTLGQIRKVFDAWFEGNPYFNTNEYGREFENFYTTILSNARRKYRDEHQDSLPSTKMRRTKARIRRAKARAERNTTL